METKQRSSAGSRPAFFRVPPWLFAIGTWQIRTLLIPGETVGTLAIAGRRDRLPNMEGFRVCSQG